MNEARDNVKLALPFTAGALSSSCIFPDIQYTYIAAGTSMLMLTTLMLLILWQIGKNPTARIWELVFLYFITGFCIQATTELTLWTGSSSARGSTGHIVAALQTWTDSIGFETDRTNALIKALLTGNRKDIPPEITEAFRKSGASHILALSGLHLGIIYMILCRVMSITGGGNTAKILRSAVCVSVCAAYSFATGAGASIIRALIFIIVRETGTLLHRSPDLKTILISSMFIHLSIYPSDVTSVGFQLSYAALAGIAWIHPMLLNLWPDEGEGKTIMKRIWESASVSISCQLTTGPLAWYYFGTFPQYFMLTNLIAIPLTAVIIPLALLTIFLHIIGLCPDMLIFCTEKIVDTLCWMLSLISSL